MTEPDDDREIESLFERSAAEPSPFELTRMAARARELPERLERVPRRLPRWSWAPAFAAFAALGALGVTLTQVLSPEERSEAPSAAPPLRTPATTGATNPDAPLVPAEPSASAEPRGSASPDDDSDLDAFMLTSETDDDPFDLSSAEETEMSP